MIHPHCLHTVLLDINRHNSSTSALIKSHALGAIFLSGVRFAGYSFLHHHPQTKERKAAHSSLSTLLSSGGLPCCLPPRPGLPAQRLSSCHAEFPPTSAGGRKRPTQVPQHSGNAGHQGSLRAWSPEGLFSSTSSTSY